MKIIPTGRNRIVETEFGFHPQFECVKEGLFQKPELDWEPWREALPTFAGRSIHYHARIYKTKKEALAFLKYAKNGPRITTYEV